MKKGVVCEHLEAGYGRVEVLRGISLSIREDETVALLGPNGSGKSTLAKTIMNLTTVHAGRIYWDGREITGMPTWRIANAGMRCLPQIGPAFASLTVEENLRLGTAGLSPHEVDLRLAEIYDRFPLLRARKRVVSGRLSGGERRMLGLATTVVQEPRFLILDEPTTDLAPTAVDLVFDKIREIRHDFELPLLLIEQNVDKALELADRVCILVQGCLVCDRPVDEICEEEIGRIFLQKDGQG